jgi:hypothetical protein
MEIENPMLLDPDEYDLGVLPHQRWNVLDLITVIARPTRPAYIFCDVDMSRIEMLRQKLKEQGKPITVTAALLKAISIAQVDFPDARTYLLPWGARVVDPVPVAGFTVERQVDGQPVVFFANMPGIEHMTLQEVAKQLLQYGKGDIQDVPQLAKEVFLTKWPWLLRRIGMLIGLCVPLIRREVNCATFGLTSLGKFGMRSVIGPCVRTCIFGVGSQEDRPVVQDGKIVVRPMMLLELSVDTNVMTEFRAAEFFARIKHLIETGMEGHLEGDEIIDYREMEKARDDREAQEKHDQDKKVIQSDRFMLKALRDSRKLARSTAESKLLA